MRLAFLRSETDHAVFDDLEDDGRAEKLRISAKAGSSSKNIIVELLRRGLIEDAAEWKFWPHDTARLSVSDTLPVDVFQTDEGRLRGLEAEIAARGAPEILWVEGPHHPPFLARVFELCAESFKLVYSKDWKPWKIENLAAFDLCLVDEQAQADRVRKTAPNLRCGIWDKLIDYETTHQPIDCEKEFDLCYVAYFRSRKNHELLFEAMARLLPERRVSCVLIGGDRLDRQGELEEMASHLDLDVSFVGEVAKSEVNAYVNKSRIGLMLSEKDAAPRVILEYLAANLPVLVNSELRAGARYVDARSGLVLPPGRLHEGIATLLDNQGAYTPREAYLERFSRDQVIERFVGAVEAAGGPLKTGAEVS